jgi:hypothetical protein
MKTLAPLFVVIAFIAVPLAIQTVSISPIKARTMAQAHAGYVLKRISSRAVHHEWAASPRLRFWESTSGNWSGYAVPLETSGTKDTFSEVQGTWTVPAVTGLLSAAYSSLWVGLDGYTSGTVEQIGTEQDWSGQTESNYVWFEMYPNYAYEIEGFPDKPGDSISAKVQYLGQGTVRAGRRSETVSVFQLSITNNTENASFTVPTSYTYTASAARSSAEWVLEAPSDDEILPLADFGEAFFSNCEAASSHSGGKLVPVNSWILDPLTMIDPDGGSATPSALSSNGEAFSVTYTGN